MVTKLPKGISLVPNGVFGHDSYGSAYLLGEEELALVDPGTSKSLPNLLDWFENSRGSLSELDSILLTHVHLDHCGGTGDLVEKVPDVTVYLHENGARHLKDPSELLASVKRATGERFEQYGSLKPVPEANICPIGDERELKIGGRQIHALPTPGHAPHHISYYDEVTGGLFTGDSAGLYLDGKLIPATPPPTFNLESSLESLDRMKRLEPSTLLFSHFGAGKAATSLLDEYASVLRNWVARVENLYGDGFTREEITKRVGEDWDDWFVDGFSRGELEMNVKGVMKYLDWRKDELG